MDGMSRSSLAFEEAAHQGPASLPFRVVHTYLIYVPFFLHLHIVRLKVFIGRGPNHENEKIITAVCFFTVIIHIKDLENVCNTQRSDLAMGLFC